MGRQGHIGFQVAYVLVFLVDGLIVIQLIWAAMDREISLLEAVVFVVLLMGVNGIMLTHAGDPLGPAMALIIVAFAATHGLLRSLANERALLAIKMQDLHHYQRMIAERPKWAYPYKCLGDFFFERRMWAEAIQFYEQSLALQPDPEVRWHLDYAREELRREEQRLRICPQCLSEVSRDVRECPLCQHYLGGGGIAELLSRGSALGTVVIGLLVVGALSWSAIRLASVSLPLLLALLPIVMLVFLYGRWFVTSSRLRRG